MKTAALIIFFPVRLIFAAAEVVLGGGFWMLAVGLGFDLEEKKFDYANREYLLHAKTPDPFPEYPPQ